MSAPKRKCGICGEYGYEIHSPHDCAAPLLARIAELESQVREQGEALKNERAAHRERIVELEREFREDIQSAIAEYRWSRKENQGW